MFLNIQRDGLPRRSLLNELVAPRPIGWISTRSAEGEDNLAPFSHFMVVSTAPPVVIFSCNAPVDRVAKDTLANARETGEFVVNMATEIHAEHMVATSEAAPFDVDEFSISGLQKSPCELVSPARVSGAPAALECIVKDIILIAEDGAGESNSHVVFGRVVAVHMEDEFLDENGRFETAKAKPLARLGGREYLTASEVFELEPRFRARD